MKKIRHRFLMVAVLCLGALAAVYTSRHLPERESGFGENEAMEEDIAGRVAWMNKMLADPATGRIPEDIRKNELAYSATLPSMNHFNKTFGIYIPRGPWNVGGRTRGIVIDKTNENVLLAGSTMGGFWRSTDGGASWRKCIDSAETSNISCIVQDTRTGKTNTWYAGTGEVYGASLPGASFSGNGVYKSTDNGLSWKRLAYTSTTPGGIHNAWSAVNRVAVNTAIDSLDVLFVATFDGIWRSVDGGVSFSRRRGATLGGYSLWTDVAVTKSGVVYATLSAGGSTNAGIWRSTNNGATWSNITPSFFIGTSRVVMGICPSDEKQIYFAAYSPGTGKQSLNFEKTPEWNSLWKYTYISGDGTGTGGQWEDRSANIPTMGGDFGDFISQQGYCLSVDVKPDDPNTVFLGGTNLYRSTDGFSTSTKTTWIGGYGVNTSRPNYKVYPNHHPDNHGVVFYPLNPSRMISLHDGGISRTENCLDSSVTWNSLNSGYLNTQFYTIAIDHTSTNDIVVGGLQDNGTLYTNNQNQLSPWNSPLGGDGSYCFLAPGGNEAYLSSQQGKMQRVIMDSAGNRVQSARIDPQGLSKNTYQFINPFTPDANNWKRIYLPYGNRMWRNDDVSAIPLHPQLDTNAVLTNWNELAKTTLTDATDEITAVLSSKSQTDVVYYGTQKGGLYRLRNASDTASAPVKIDNQSFMNSYVNCIVQHPVDTSRLFVVLTNYGVLSIFQTTNGGLSWTPISGNLEENTNGSGNGPSCRWLTIATVNDSFIYFVGTSTGLYATKTLNGMQTVWVNQSPNVIGNNIVMMMDYRTTDGMLVVATYGAGVFSTKIQSVNDGLMDPYALRDHVTMYPNPVKDMLNVEGMNCKGFSYQVRGMDGRLVMEGKMQGNAISFERCAAGTYVVGIGERGSMVHKKVLKE